jgi:hypothetical protein
VNTNIKRATRKHQTYDVAHSGLLNPPIKALQRRGRTNPKLDKGTRGHRKTHRPSPKPIGCCWSYYAFRTGHVAPVWQPYIGRLIPVAADQTSNRPENTGRVLSLNGDTARSTTHGQTRTLKCPMQYAIFRAPSFCKLHKRLREMILGWQKSSESPL